jgi:hypothetical protein
VQDGFSYGLRLLQHLRIGEAKDSKSVQLEEPAAPLVSGLGLV